MKDVIIFVCLVVVAIIFYGVGYIAGNKKHESAVGVYRFDKWNGNDTVVLVINDDGTCILPTGSTGRWIQNGDILKIFSNDEPEVVDVVTNGTGIGYNGFFFERVS